MSKKWFTLVELIVVITMLAILWTIWFISLQWYSKDSRNVARLNDVNIMKKALELYSLKFNKYPEPTWPTSAISYSWTTVWEQWIFWNSVISNIWSMSKYPVDPLTWSPYAYSLLNTKLEYELGWILEWTVASKLSNKANAEWTIVATSYVKWNYNWKVAKANVAWVDYVLAVPTIINSDLTFWDIEDMVDHNKFSISKWTVLPASYSWTSLKVSWNAWEKQVNNWKLVVYSWDLNSIDNKIFLENLQSAYSWTSSEWISAIKLLTTVDVNNTNEVNNVVTNLVNNNLWANNAVPEKEIIEVINPYKNCTAKWVKLVADSTYWNCENNDIIICSGLETWYTVSACNLWSNTSNWYWYYYQFWRNNPWFTKWLSTNNYDWLAPGWTDAWSANNWWVSETDKTSIEYNNSTDENKIKMQWACEAWYHVPTIRDWLNLEIVWWWNEDWLSMRSDLKLPKAWTKKWDTWSPTWVWSNANYWTSSPNWWNSAYYFILRDSNINSASFYRSYWFSIRCFKN